MLSKIRAGWKAFDSVCSSRRGRFVISVCYSVVAAYVWHRCGSDDAYEKIAMADDIFITDPKGQRHAFKRVSE